MHGNWRIYFEMRLFYSLKLKYNFIKFETATNFYANAEFPFFVRIISTVTKCFIDSITLRMNNLEHKVSENLNKRNIIEMPMIIIFTVDLIYKSNIVKKQRAHYFL